MAKKKLNVDDELALIERLESSVVVKDFIDKEYQEGIFSSAKDLLANTKQVIPVSPCLDIPLHGGIPTGCIVICSGKPKSGKAQPLDSIVYTPFGPKRIGDVCVGDLVCTPDNDYARVTGVYPQGVKEVYQITFLDGDTVECCAEHLWEVKQRNSNPVVKTTHSLIGNLRQKSGRTKWALKLPSNVRFQERPVEIEPYLMGLLLGDGSFRASSLKFTNTDKEILTNVQTLLDDDYVLTPNTNKQQTIDYCIAHKDNLGRRSSGCKTRTKNEYIGHLKQYGLWGLTSHHKFIPDVYKYNSISVRLSLLQGLLDTDGDVSKTRGTISYTSASLRLIKDVKEVAQSLGCLCSIKSRYTYCNGKRFLSYRCNIRSNNPSSLVRLSRKRSLTKIRTKKPLVRRIASIDLLQKKECVCISISSAEGLYLTNHSIVTHNTSLALSFAANCQKPEHGSRDVYYLDIEHRLKQMNISGTMGLNPDKFHVVRSVKGKILHAEDYLNIAVRIVQDCPNALIILDSTSSLCAEKEMIDEVTGTARVSGPKLLANFTRKVSNIVPVNGSIIWAVQHVIANTSGYGPSFMEDGGNKIWYAADVKIRVKGFESWNAGDKNDGKPIGQKVKWQIVCSALGGTPNQEIEGYLRYGIGIDHLYELMILGLNLGIIKASGAWLQFGEMKKQGKENLYEALKESPETVQSLITLLKGVFG